MHSYQVTGNEYVSLPTIEQDTGAMEGLTFLHMGAKGMIELKGKEQSFLCPIVQVNGAKKDISDVTWHRDYDWIPTMKGRCDEVSLAITYLCPLNERAFFLHLEVENKGEACEISLGAKGQWSETWHAVNENILLDGQPTQQASGWNNAFVMQKMAGLPLCAFAPIAKNVKWTWQNGCFEGIATRTLQPNEKYAIDLIFGIGYETVAAATSAKHLLRLSYERCYEQTAQWLKTRFISIKDKKLSTLFHTNLFFAFFFSAGKTLDTEEFCLVTSRSPRYYVSAAYWDRDSLLWSFPALLLVDASYAKEMLLYVFGKQIKNIGVHSRYIDGTVLEPGFELDELCAPVIALKRYIEKTSDDEILALPCIKEGLVRIYHILKRQKHPSIALYETFLQPTDDEIVYPYLTYDNVLVWKTLHALARWLHHPSLALQAEEVKQAIDAYCVQEGQFIWSTDAKGRYDFYDEPPGSLQLLPHYGFCDKEDPRWLKTMQTIRSSSYRFSFADHPIAEIGCLHAPHPWILSICNSLLSGHENTAFEHLKRTQMDNGIACESVNEDTGVCETGEAFATCAGFLSFALWHALTEHPLNDKN